MVVNAEVLRDPADADAAAVHGAADGGNELVDRDHKRVRNAHGSEKTTEGSESFSPRPPLLNRLYSARYGMRKPDALEAGQEKTAGKRGRMNGR